MVSYRFLIKGRVQGVGFRYFAMNIAKRLGLAGWVKNNFDGSVSAVACGPEKEVADFEEELKIGPSYGRVDYVMEEEISEKYFGDFIIRY